MTATDNIPPSSLHSFRRILKNVTESGSLTEILIADHNAQFTNMFYNSALDDYTKIGFDYHNITVGSDGICKIFIFYTLLSGCSIFINCWLFLGFRT